MYIKHVLPTRNFLFALKIDIISNVNTVTFWMVFNGEVSSIARKHYMMCNIDVKSFLFVFFFP